MNDFARDKDLIPPPANHNVHYPLHELACQLLRPQFISVWPDFLTMVTPPNLPRKLYMFSVVPLS